MIIEKYGKVCLFGNDQIQISDFTFDCKGKEFCLDESIIRTLYYARGIINRNLKVLEGGYEDYAP